MGLFKSLFSLDPNSMKTHRASQNLSDAIVAIREKYGFEIFAYSEGVTFSQFIGESLELDNLMEITLEINASNGTKRLHIDFRRCWGGASIMKKYGKKKKGIYYQFFDATSLTYGSTLRTDEFIDLFLTESDRMMLLQQ
jgi:hypothetical protein